MSELKSNSELKREDELIVCQIVEKLLLNIFKDGMTEAAKIAESLCTCSEGSSNEDTWCDRCQQNMFVRRTILSARDNKAFI